MSRQKKYEQQKKIGATNDEKWPKNVMNNPKEKRIRITLLFT